jgi:hypothetical protein
MAREEGSEHMQAIVGSPESLGVMRPRFKKSWLCMPLKMLEEALITYLEGFWPERLMGLTAGIDRQKEIALGDM